MKVELTSCPNCESVKVSVRDDGIYGYALCRSCGHAGDTMRKQDGEEGPAFAERVASWWRKEVEIPPCSCCHGDDLKIARSSDNLHSVYCRGCCASGPAAENPADAVEEWRRSQIPPIPVVETSDAWSQTSSGCRFEFGSDAPRYTAFDVSRGLGRLCRFGGQIRQEFEFYSVAEHCVLLTRWAARHMNDVKTVQTFRTILFHDAPEAFVGDLIRPVKRMLPAFSEIEDRIYASVAERFDLLCPIPEFVKALDDRMLRTERDQVMWGNDHPWITDDLEPLDVTIEGWLPRRATEEFQRLADDLGVRHWTNEEGPCA